jgi:hypothetical protein
MSTAGRRPEPGRTGEERELWARMYGVSRARTGRFGDRLVDRALVDVVEAEAAATELIGLAGHPTLPRLLLGVEPPTDEMPDRTRPAADVDLDRIRRLLDLVVPSHQT